MRNRTEIIERLVIPVPEGCGSPEGCLGVATLGIGNAGAKNAGLLAVAILAGKRPDLRRKLHAFRAKQSSDVLKAKLP